jgi:LDH2 family malate/lactate/ureidoglycolate dehydrogenase
LDVATQVPHGSVRAYVMGERGARNFERRSREGIPLTPKALAGLVELAEKAGVAPPQLM